MKKTHFSSPHDPIIRYWTHYGCVPRLFHGEILTTPTPLHIPESLCGVAEFHRKSCSSLCSFLLLLVLYPLSNFYFSTLAVVEAVEYASRSLTAGYHWSAVAPCYHGLLQTGYSTTWHKKENEEKGNGRRSDEAIFYGRGVFVSCSSPRPTCGLSPTRTSDEKEETETKKQVLSKRLEKARKSTVKPGNASEMITNCSQCMVTARFLCWLHRYNASKRVRGERRRLPVSTNTERAARRTTGRRQEKQMSVRTLTYCASNLDR